MKENKSFKVHCTIGYSFKKNFHDTAIANSRCMKYKKAAERDVWVFGN
jgi:hypothetical protein